MLSYLQAKSKKGKPKTSNYNGTPLKLINATFTHICAWLATSGMFPEPMEFDRKVRKCWRAAAAELKVDVAKFPVEDEHIKCVSF
jgi:hypothetical protein